MTPDLPDSGRVEDDRLLRGNGRFTANLKVPGTLFAAFVRSPEAHARIQSVDLSAARSTDGVVAAFGAAELRLNDLPSATGAGPVLDTMAHPPLARHVVRHVGEAVAVVVARSEAFAEDAVELVDVDYESLPVAATLDAAMTDHVLLFPEAGTNTLYHRFAGSSPPANAPVELELTVEVPRLAPVPIEPLSALAVPAGTHLTLHCAHQTPHRLRRILAAVIGIDERNVDVVVGDVGGGFGLKGMIYPEYAVTAALSRRLNRPVRWVQSRTEQFLVGTHGRAQRQTITVTGDRDGRVSGLAIRILANVGAYPHNGSAMPLTTTELLPGPYDIDRVGIDVQIVVTNTAPLGAYRGAGRPEATYGVERAIDAFAAEIAMDPAEVRRRNLLAPAAIPHTTARGQVLEAADFPAALDLALNLADVDAVRIEQTERRAVGANPVGIGIGMFVERAGGRGGAGEHARIRLRDDGTIEATVGSSSTGQGHETVWARVVADAIGVAAQKVVVRDGDTRELRTGIGTFGSRSAQATGSILHRLGGELAACLRQDATGLLEIAEEDLELFDGHQFAVRGDPSRNVTLAQIAQSLKEPLLVEGHSDLEVTFPYGAHVAVVEVDLDTGAVGLTRLVAVDDCGRVLHEAVVEGQVHGSVAQGVAAALFEEMVYDESGQPLTTTLMDYHIPTALDLPNVTTGRIEVPTGRNVLGVKGIGESGCIGMPPAVVNAVLDALGPHGVTTLDIPLTPHRVWRALRDASSRRP